MKIVNDIAILEGDQYISKWAVESGRLDHDQNTLPYILPHVKGVVIDIGAYIGDHTIAYAKQANKVIAFEPNAEAFECLEYNLKSFKNTELRSEGVSDSSEKIAIVEDKDNPGKAYAKKVKKGIKCITIDSLELEALDFIKIDAEGYEHKILKGAEETIKRFKPVMVIEINNEALNRNGTTENDVYIYLMDLGYTVKSIYPGQPLHAEQLDIICIPKP